MNAGKLFASLFLIFIVAAPARIQAQTPDLSKGQVTIPYAELKDLLEALDYVAELLDLKADDTIPGTGWVIEAISVKKE